MADIAGTLGYAEVAERFADLSESIAFEAIHECLLPLLPAAPARLLDIGAGTGRDAGALAAWGHDVVAVEPTPELIAEGRRRHRSPRIRWIEDGFPELAGIRGEEGAFDFVLCHAVWQHVSPEHRPAALRRAAELVKAGGVFALGLRHGQPGAGRHYFPPATKETIRLAQGVGFELRLFLPDQPSAIPGKPVTWTRLAFERSATRP